MTTKTRTICTECADRYYEYEIGAESDEYCPACLFAKYKKALEEVEDTKQWASELEDSRKEQEDEARELVKERNKLVAQVENLEVELEELRAQLEEKRASEIIAVKLNAGIVKAVDLDDPEVRSFFGISWEAVGKGHKHIRVRGTRSSLGKLLCRCRTRYKENWHNPKHAHYARSARAAMERLEAIL